MISFRPLTSRLARRLTRTELKDCAVEMVELSPPSHRYRPPAISLPGEIDRALAFIDLVPEKVRAHMTEGEELHPATTAMRLADAVLADGCVYMRSAVSVITAEKKRAILAGPEEGVAEAQLCSTSLGSQYFGDWLMMDMPLELLAAQRRIPSIALTNRTYGHEPEYRSKLSLAPPPRPASILRAESLWIVDDNGMTEDRVARYEALRRRVRQPDSGGPERVFLDRGGKWGAHRQPVNYREIVDALLSRGFTPVRPEEMTVEEISIALSSARICIGVEGSALAHATMMMPPGACLLVLMPPFRVIDAIKWFADAVGLRYGFVIGDAGAAGTEEFSIDLRRLNATLDLVERADGATASR